MREEKEREEVVFRKSASRGCVYKKFFFSLSLFYRGSERANVAQYSLSELFSLLGRSGGAYAFIAFLRIGLILAIGRRKSVSHIIAEINFPAMKFISAMV